ncbi:hypothetical protein N7495_004347 [Penicillium taxi]|uniref:uncharacterized protein n=1 Tax=Penicillium taxi TaxID=168475 RepID=UPI0025456AF3|nr:uncharacterized protein N7495_004347 [Penicillium taxi]KAJ5899603.1 hypothetical protein N7495_004347 [Penicillium taxi]
MTRLRGASLDSPDIARSTAERPQYYRSKVPPNAPESIVENTVEVTDPSRVLPWYRDERRRRYNTLVRRSVVAPKRTVDTTSERDKTNLLHGCDDPGCRTPTCASRRRTTSDGPYRRYTELSARTLACYLASLDDAESGLCCNNPRLPSELTVYDYHRISLQRSRAFQAQAAAANATEEQSGSIRTDYNRNGGNAFKNRMEISQADASGFASNAAGPEISQNITYPSAYYLHDFDCAAEQPLKDPKSFTQNLFDTISLRMVEWLPLRRTTETFPSKARQSLSHPNPDLIPSNTEKEQRQQGNETRNPKPVRRTPTSHPQNPQPRTPSSRNSGPQPTAVEVKFQNQHVKRLSITEVDHWRQSSRSAIEEARSSEYKPQKFAMNTHLPTSEFTPLPSPPALKHRPQKHRGRIGEVENTSLPERSKNQRRVSWDSGKFLNQNLVEDSLVNPRVPLPKSNVDIDSPSNRKAKHELRRQSPDPPFLAQTVTHLNPHIIDGLRQIMIESQEDSEIWKEELDRIQSMGGFDNPEWRFATPRQCQVFPFIAQSVFFVFSSSRHILRSFGTDETGLNTSKQSTIISCLDVPNLLGSLQLLHTICPWDIVLHSVWSALDKLFLPPADFTSSARHSRRSSRSSIMTGPTAAPPVVRRMSEAFNDEHLSDADAAYIATVALFTLVSSVPALDVRTWHNLLRMRAAGGVASSADLQKLSPEQAQQAVEMTDRLDHELALRLVNRLVRALTARLAYHEILKARQGYGLDLPKQRRVSVLDRIMDHLSEHHNLESSGAEGKSSQTPGPAPLIVEWLRTLLLREWDGNPEMARSSAAGGAIQIMALMYKERNRLGLLPEIFQTPILAERLDPLDMPVAWAGNLSNNRTMHLLSYPFLFPPSFLVIYFRALNYSAMAKYFEAAMTTTRHVTQTAFGSISVRDDTALLERLKVSMSTYLVLVVRRDRTLTDAMDQLWRREKRELMRPLKVQMGMDEGEEGLDHGGVQQEFFRVIMREALDPSHGMFTMDTRHRISWFYPCSLEPLYKFELLGTLISIAVYNGLTLPINFPVAFYRKLLGLKVKHLDHIKDGWPELVQGLEVLLKWSDGDVGDIFLRTYEISFESFGQIKTVDMQRVRRDAVWPVHESLPLQSPAPSEEAALVTNQNRHQFVKDYIFWLTDKSIRSQFEAFVRGFHTCLDRSALSIFTPEALKTVVEGIQEIDIKELENHVRYEGGFGPSHRVIRDFWHVVKQYPAEKKARLLEFVTASDRIPVNGISSIMFVIQKNGVGDLRLPTSLTCFGRLLLPEYSSQEALIEKLDKALENAQGFGVA